MKTKILMALLAGATLFAACKSSGNSADDKLAQEVIDSAKLIKTVNMRVKVKNVQSAGESITRLAYTCGGQVVHHNMLSNKIDSQRITLANDSIQKLSVYNPTADIVLKIPSAVVEPFMDSLNHLGMFVEGRTMDVEDKTLDYLSTKMKVKNREESVVLRRKIKPVTQQGADSIMQLKDDEVDKKINNLRTNANAVYSTLTLTLYQDHVISKVTVANDDLSTYKTSLSVRAGQAMASGWFYFSEMIVAILNFWAFLLAAGLIWLSIIFYRRKKINSTKPVA